jgi:hypothetical protein
VFVVEMGIVFGQVKVKDVTVPSMGAYRGVEV